MFIVATTRILAPLKKFILQIRCQVRGSTSTKSSPYDDSLHSFRSSHPLALLNHLGNSAFLKNAAVSYVTLEIQTLGAHTLRGLASIGWEPGVDEAFETFKKLRI